MMLLDASAVLGYLNHEPGSEVMEATLLAGEACISLVNQTEVISKLCDWGMDWETAERAFRMLALNLEPFAVEHALDAARIRPLTRALGLSLGDRACLATARLRKLAVLTGDRPWLGVSSVLGVAIESFRPAEH